MVMKGRMDRDRSVCADACIQLAGIFQWLARASLCRSYRTGILDSLLLWRQIGSDWTKSGLVADDPDPAQPTLSGSRLCITAFETTLIWTKGLMPPRLVLSLNHDDRDHRTGAAGAVARRRVLAHHRVAHRRDRPDPAGARRRLPDPFACVSPAPLFSPLPC